LKAHWRKNKWKAYNEIIANRLSHKTPLKDLGFNHFMQCFKPAWDRAFNIEANMKGWAIEGIIPYTRRALWRKRGAPKPDSPELPNFSWTSDRKSVV
jgi:hypothetical protein